MANVSIDRVDAVSHYLIVSAAACSSVVNCGVEANRRLLASSGLGTFLRPIVQHLPNRGIVIVVELHYFILTRDGRVSVDVRTVCYLLSGDQYG